MVKKLILFIFILCAVGFGYINRSKIKALFKEDTRTINRNEVKLLFQEDPTFLELKSVLIDKGILENDKSIESFVEKNKIDTTKFAAGKYIILSQTQLSSLVNGFVKNENGHGNAELKVNVDFNNCRFISDIGKNISKCIKADSASIVSYILNANTLKHYGFSEEQIPALFIPKRYKMYYDTDAEEFVAEMAREFKVFWNKERLMKMKQIGLTAPSRVTTLASIVYSEQSKKSEEWNIIAGLYLNRLNKRMKLESDPTFKFCWGTELDHVQRLLYVHRDIDCAYNTYLYSGLPPGPICLVPQEVIDAVLNPTKTKYLFMCGKPGGGGHNFAETNSGHEKNVRIYKKWLKEYMKNN